MTSWGSPTSDPLPAVIAATAPDVADQAAADEQFDLAAHRSGVRRSRARRIGIGAAGLILILLLWQAASAILRDSVILPSVTQRARTFVHYLHHPYPTQSKSLGVDLAISLRRILIGFAIGTALGIAIGAAMSANQFTRQLIDPVIEVIRPLPPPAFIPLLIVWFGIGELPKEVLIVFGIVPIMVVATVAALDEVPDDLRLCARTLGASRNYALLHVQIPAALPGIVTGMRFAMAGAWTSIVAAEIIAATSGVGYLISQAGDYLNTSLVFAGIITIAIAGLVLDACLRGLLLFVDPSRRS
jgi:NitT/TauT family transport system permease protein/taurine transport system permease protein